MSAKHIEHFYIYTKLKYLNWECKGWLHFPLHKCLKNLCTVNTALGCIFLLLRFKRELIILSEPGKKF